MKTTSKQIENELNQTTKRLDELTEMRMRLNTELQTLQQGFIGGKTSLDELQTEQGKLTILNESIKALEANQDELHTAFQKAILSESRSAILEQMKKTATEGQASFDEYLAIRAELSGIIGEYAERLIDKSTVFHNSRADYQSLSRRIEPELADYLTHGQHSNRRLELGKSIAEEIKALDVSDEALRLITDEAIIPPGVKFGQPIAIAEGFAAQEKQREIGKAAKDAA
jgi:uncharacterized coiled-coil DUF342 family protein